ncbi:MAG: hypothetical protein MJ231_03060 [bacterium]|nr:hypothetical protein [bacterium]
MGLAASQARYLALVAQQTNLQYQGQQINQERSVLAQQTAELYSTLLGMDVPTPPSTKAYTKVQYQGVSGGVKYAFDTSDIVPCENNMYTITLNNTVYGSCIVETADTVTVRKDMKEIKGTTINGDGKTIVTDADIENLYVIDAAGNCVKANKNTDFDKDEDDNYVLRSGVKYFRKDDAGEESRQIDAAGGITVSGHDAYTLDQARDLGKITKEEYDGYVTGIINAAITKDNGEKTLDKDSFLIYLDDGGKAHFILKDDATKDKNQAHRYDYNPTGEYIKKEKKKDCQIEFDPSTGRITNIKVPNRDAEGNISSYTSISVEASEVTDTVAYDKANADYKYQQYLYDKEQQDINARIEIIQKEDRNLELKLSRLDTQNKEIDTELEALKKVLEKNIDNSYKTFNG